MMSLLWYYRPEHTKQGRQKEDMPDELFASKHRDVNSVACIDDRCYVLTFNEYCRSVFLQCFVFHNPPPIITRLGALNIYRSCVLAVYPEHFFDAGRAGAKHFFFFMGS